MLFAVYGRTVTTGCLPDASGMPPGYLRPLDISTSPGDHQVMRPPRAAVMGSYPSIDHGIFGRLRPSSLVLNTFKIMYLDGWVSQPESHSFRQSDSINKSSRLIHDRLLAPVPYCVNSYEPGIVLALKNHQISNPFDTFRLNPAASLAWLQSRLLPSPLTLSQRGQLH